MSSSASSVISHYRRKMERHPKESDVLLHCLSKLDRVEVNIALLQETGIGRVVNSLKKSDQEDVSEKARLLVAKWKDVVAKEDDEEEEENQSQEVRPQEREEQEPEEEEEEEEEEEVEEEEEEIKAPTPSPPRSSSSHHKKHKKKKSSHRENSSHGESTNQGSSSKKQKKETLKASDSFGHALMNISGTGTGSSSSSSSKKKKSSKEDRSESSSSHKRNHSDSSSKRSSHKKSHSESSSSKKSSHSESSSKKSYHSESRSSSSSSQPSSSKKLDSMEPVSIPSDLLPTISPNYKPLPPKKESNNGVKKFQNDDEALSSLISMSKSSKRTAVFSGVKKSGYYGPIPTLMEMCITVLQENVDDIYECGGLDFITLKPILERAGPQTLAQIEEHNQYLMTETGDLWERFCKKNFPKEKRQEMESWREMFERCTVEREEKLNLLKVKVKDSYKKVESSYRQTKLAYVGTVAKPPRSVSRAQAKNGTAIPFGNPLKRPMVNSNSGTGSSKSSSSSISSAPKKPKMAPLMSKTLKMARGIKGGFRR